MSLKGETQDKFIRPETFLAELMRRGVQGTLLDRGDGITFLYRALVVAVDVVGGKLENPEGKDGVVHVIDGKSVNVPANAGPKNPRNSIKGRIISDGFDQFIDDDGLRVFWPFFPEHISVPVKPGEHVYVMFEDANLQHGLWITKIPGHENVNMFKGSDAFAASDKGGLSDMFDDTRGLSGPTDDLSTDRAAGEVLANTGQLTSKF